MAEIANAFRDGGQVDNCNTWLERGILDAAGNLPIQEYLGACRQTGQKVDSRRILGRPVNNGPSDAGGKRTAPVHSEKAIRQRAYSKWEAAGRPPGDGACFWIEAERELLSGG